MALWSNCSLSPWDFWISRSVQIIRIYWDRPDWIGIKWYGACFMFWGSFPSSIFGGPLFSIAQWSLFSLSSGVSSVGDESVSFLFFPVVLGICRSSLIGVENAWASRRVFETTDSPFAPRELLIVYEHRD